MVKLSIRGRVSLLVLSSVMVAVLTVGAVAFYGLRSAMESMTEQENVLDAFLTESMAGYAEKYAKERLRKTAEVKARYIDRELAMIGEDVVKDAVSGKDGISFVLDGKGRVLFSSEKKGILAAAPEAPDLRQIASPSVAEAARRMIAGESGVMSIEVDGEVYYFAYAPMSSVGWSFGTVIEDDEVLDPVKQVTEDVREKMTAFREVLQQVFLDSMVKVVVVLLPVLLLVLYGSGTLAERVTRPIRKLAAGVREIAEGNFDKKLAIDTGDEIEHLAICFNAMTDSLKEHTRQLEQVAAEKEHARTELEVAAKIQMGMLPGTFPAFPERKDFGIYALMHPAKDVGGDFYDFYLLDENHLVVTVADVSGKGIPAALFMAMSKTILRNCVMMAKQQEDLAAVLENANHQLCQNNESAMFVTVLLGVLDLRTGRFVYADAGHCPPLLGHGGSYGFLPMEKCCMLGLLEQPYEQQSIDLSPGDTLFLYTDGVSEAMDEQRNQFTEQRIRDTLDALPPEEAIEDILPEVLERIRQHAGDAEQSDDITMLGLRYYGSRC